MTVFAVSPDIHTGEETIYSEYTEDSSLTWVFRNIDVKVWGKLHLAGHYRPGLLQQVGS